MKLPESIPEGPEKKRHPRLSLAWKMLTISFGVSLVLLGIAGLFLPILQGWLMIFAGLAVLSPHSRRARWILKTLKEKVGIHRKPEDGEAGGAVVSEADAERDMKTGS